MKTIARPCCRAFFNRRPRPLLPMADPFSIPLPGTARRPLRTPPQAHQNFPDMPRMVADAELLLDQMRHARARPEWCFVSQSFRAFQQEFFQPPVVLRPQQRLASRPARLFQRRFASFPILPSPSRHGLPRHGHPSCYLRVTQSLVYQSNSFQSPPLQRRKVPSHACRVSHASLDVVNPRLVSLYYAGLNRSFICGARTRFLSRSESGINEGEGG